MPAPPRIVISTPFDLFARGSVQAVPEDFTVWGVKKIPREGKSGEDADPFFCRRL